MNVFNLARNFNYIVDKTVSLKMYSAALRVSIGHNAMTGVSIHYFRFNQSNNFRETMMDFWVCEAIQNWNIVDTALFAVNAGRHYLACNLSGG